jgi:hypothetical protein
MTAQEELRIAWALWHLHSPLTDIFWESYEDEFMKPCVELDRTSPDQFGRSETNGYS